MKTYSFFRLLCALLIFFFTNGKYAICQEKFKFGKISNEELEMRTFTNDSSAKAVVLYEEGITFYNFTNDFNLNTEITERIKILKQEGVDLGTVNIHYYVRGNQKERISEIDAWAYNLENGKIEKSKLDKKFIFEEKINDNLYQIKFAIPNVKTGSVIEYRYKKSSPFYYNLPEWYFQRSSIPVIFSRYDVTIPEYFIYKIDTKGYEHIQAEEKQTSQTINIVQGGKSIRVPHNARNLILTAENLPAMKDDGFVWNAKDYLSSAVFELAATNFPGSMYKSYTSTWEEIEKTLQSNTEFVKSFTKKTALNDDVKQFDNIVDEQSKIEAIYNYVKDKIRWNGEYAFYDNASDALKSGLGNNVQINGLIISALNSSGIKSYPVLLRRRSQGRLPVSMPSLDKLTTYIAAAETKEGTVFYMDGSATRGGLNMLPTDLLVTQARTFNLKEGGKWVDLTKLTQNLTIISNNAKLTSDGLLECKIETLHKNQPAYIFKNKISNQKDSTEYIEKFQNENNIDIISYSVKGHDDNLANSVRETIVIKKENSPRGDFIYINPLIIPHTTKNAFIQSERKLPIEFEYPMTFQIITLLEIPEDYMIEELPKSAKTTFEDSGGGFNYMISETNNKIQLNYKFYLNELLFPYTSYNTLKEFWGHLTTKNTEMIVLKKK